MAEHVRRRVLEWKCETSALDGDFEVVQTLSELNLALLTAGGLPFPHRSFWRQPTSKSGDRGNIIHGQTNCGRSMAFLCSVIYRLLHKLPPPSRPSAIPMLKAINLRHRIFMMLY